MAAQQSKSQSQKSKVFVCDQHASNISRNLQTLYMEQLLVDIALTNKTDNLKVHAHRAVLSAASGHFRAMLCSTLKEARAEVIQLEIDGPTLKLVIDFMYSGTIELRRDNVGRILIAADVLKMSSLTAACSDFIEESIDLTNWLSIASMAQEQHSTKLRETAFAFALEHFEEVRKKPDFLQLTEDNLSEIISSDNLRVDSEESVFHSLVSWLEFDRAKREKCMPKLLKHVRFSFLKSEFIMQNRHSVCKTAESFDVICSWVELNLSDTKLSKRHTERKNANGTQRVTLGFVSGSGGSFKFQTLTPEANTWSLEDFPNPPETRTNYRATAVDRKIIIVGGSLRGCVTNTVWQLDLQTKQWTNLPPMQEARELPGAIELNGDLYVVGGCSSNVSNGVWLSSLSSAEKYNFRTRKWQELAPMHSKHDYLKVTVLDGLLYAVGQSDFPIECYNPANNKWIQIPLKNERSTCVSIAGVGGYLYAVGGKYNGQESKTVERYHPATETWTVISPGLGKALRHLRCVSWNNRLVAGRGLGSQDDVQSLVEQYNPETNEWKALPSLLDNYLANSCSSLFTFVK